MPVEKEETELPKLKDLYDELWKDAKTMIRDMVKAIRMYLFSGFLLFATSYLSLVFALVYYVQITIGSATLLDYIGFFGMSFVTVFFIFSGIYFIHSYRNLKKKYAKLIKTEKLLRNR